MRRWKCTNCGNRDTKSSRPIVCDIECCKKTDTFVEVLDDGIQMPSKWKCTNCGNRISEEIPPNICAIKCCGATKSYVKISLQSGR